MAYLKKPYEISLWDDILVYEGIQCVSPTYFFLKDEAFNSGIDYQTKIDEAKSNIDKAIYEQYRNYKIFMKKEKTEKYNPTFNYVQYLKDIPKSRGLLRWDDYIAIKNIGLLPNNSTEIELEKFRKNRTIESNEKMPQYFAFIIIDQYYKERKIGIIGSNTMEVGWKTTKPYLVKNTNGTSTLTFTMYSKYYDDYSNNLKDNPFLGKMVNERKVKLFYDNEWYDFLIKNIQENSEGYSYTYTCKDLLINELSKTGYNLVFDPQLENNIGTINELARSILDESDWQLKPGSEILLRQQKEEPLYVITTIKGFEAINMDTNTLKTVEAGTNIYGFYSCVNEKKTFFQFIIPESNNPRVDSNNLLINNVNYCVNVNYNNDLVFLNENQIFSIDNLTRTQYRGLRLVKTPMTKYDYILDKYVSVFKDEGDQSSDKDIYGYSESEYFTSDTPENFIINPTNFTSTTGWIIGKNDGISLKTEPKLPPETKEEVTNIKSMLFWEKGHLLVNPCLSQNRTKINSIYKSEKFVIMLRTNKNDTFSFGGEGFSISIRPYEINNGEIIKDESDKWFTAIKSDSKTIVNKYGQEEVYRYFIVQSEKSLSFKDLLNNSYGLIFTNHTGSAPELEIYDCQLFRYYEKTEDFSDFIMPGEEVVSELKNKYYFYYPLEENTKPEEVHYLYSGYEIPNNYSLKYNENCEKIRAITESQSNRFNLLQKLCETFECWIKFEIEHEPGSGHIKLDESHRQLKWISFHEYIGIENYAGFKYGINLKSIQRTLDSDAIVTKMIVKNNNNQFAQGKFCSIAKADENPTGENFLLDFSYFINQGLLDREQLDNDLYLPVNGYIGYYTKLKEINNGIAEKIEQQSELISSTIPKAEAQRDFYKGQKTQIEQEILDLANYISSLIPPFSIENMFKQPESGDPQKKKWEEYWNDKNISSKLIAYSRLFTSLRECEENLEIYEDTEDKNGTIKPGLVTKLNEELSEVSDYLEKAAEKKQKLHFSFNKKYSHYIQEGSWTSEQYTDDNLYFLDAESTLHTSSQPKVTYNISVIDVSSIDGLELYSFHVGDKTYIEDVEFFGWDNKSTPHKEEVVVNEIKISLDSPEENTITIKNYKTQFEDLFQRIAAITTSVQFSSGDYQRAADIVNQDGTINVEVLQSTINKNSLILSNSHNESVIWDNNGITTTSLLYPNLMVRIVGGGLFVSSDHGDTWTTGVTGDGINAALITAGQLDTNKIQILNGDFPSFRWDSNGLNAYSFTKDEDGVVDSHSLNTFIRFDQYGLYGIKNTVGFDPNVGDNEGKVGEEKIKKYADFSLTWNGFNLRTKDGAVSIGTDNDIQVFDNKQVERVKIGTIEENKYGLRLNDENGNITLETADSGKIFLRDSIKISYPSDNAMYGSVELGMLGAETKDGITRNKIFSVKSKSDDNSTIVMYDDGTFIAQKAQIIGELKAGSIISGSCTINASATDEAGTLGGLINLTNGLNVSMGNLNQSINSIKGFKIESNLGSIFKINTNGIVTPQTIHFSIVGEIAKTEDIESIEWRIGSVPFGRDSLIKEQLSEGLPLKVEVNYINILNYFVGGKAYISAIITMKEKEGEAKIEEYTPYLELILQSDGAEGPRGPQGPQGQEGLSYMIECKEGFVFNSDEPDRDITLIARVYRGEELIDFGEEFEYKWYYSIDGGGFPDLDQPNGVGKTIEISTSDFNKNLQIYFTVTKKNGG